MRIFQIPVHRGNDAHPGPRDHAGLRTRAQYHGAVVGDYALRTLLASALTGAMLPGGLLLNGRAEARRLEFYAELGVRRDPAAVFIPPPDGVPVHSRRGSGLSGLDGVVDLL